MRAGIGYDIHALAKGRPFVLGGVKLPFNKGPVGHSDGDVLTHALVDAVLGAMGAGDIGDHFPDTDKKWRGVSSGVFALQVKRMLKKKGLKIAHMDSVILCERPKLAPWKDKIKKSVAGLFGVSPSSVSVKAKTNEGFGAVGKGQAVACYAVVTLKG